MIEATIIEQLPETDQPIIDISPAAAIALDIGAGGPVMVTTIGHLPQTPPIIEQKSDVEVETVVEADANVDVETDTEAEKSPFPINITINNYIVKPDKPHSEDGEKRPVRKNKSPNTDSEPNTDEILPVQPPIAAMPEEPPTKEPLYTSPPVKNIQIIPSTLPNPRSSKTYRLLVGTYPGVDSTFRVYSQLRAAGFEVIQEQTGEMCKVFATGIPAAQVFNAAQRLGAIGFEQVWIQE